jgi:flagellar motor protein MotB
MDYSKWDNIDSDDSSGDEGGESKSKSKTTSSRTLVNPSPSSSSSQPTLQVQKQPQQQQQQQQQQQAVDMAKLSPEQQQQVLAQDQALAQQQQQQQQGDAKGADGKKKEESKKRKQFKHGGQVIYEWEQDLDEVCIFIYPPPGVTAKILDVKIQVDRLSIGVMGNPPFIHERFPFLVDTDASLWTFDDEDNELQIQLQKAELGKLWPSALEGHGELSETEKQQVQKEILLERFSRENPGFDFSNAEVSGQAPDARTFMGGLDRNKIGMPS